MFCRKSYSQKKIKHLHVMTKSNYSVTSNFIRFINEEFNRKEHTFLIIDTKDNPAHKLKNISNIVWIKNPDKQDRKKFFTLLNSADRIYWHFMNRTTFMQLLLLLKPSILKKSFWVAWGADLYNWKKPGKGLKVLIRNRIMFLLRTRFRFFVGIFPADIEYFRKEFKSNARTYYASYVGGIYNPIFRKKLDLLKLEDKKKNGDIINILIGHSSSKSLNHIEVLNNLVKFKNEKIRLFLPLSYGDKEYAKVVNETAKSLFGNKVICLHEFMEEEKYMDLLSKMDVAIFNTKRQIGLGNIAPLLFMGKKIFIPKGSIMYEYYKSVGINICDYLGIEKMDFNRFTESIDMTNAEKYVVSNVINKSKKIEMWNNVFNAHL